MAAVVLLVASRGGTGWMASVRGSKSDGYKNLASRIILTSVAKDPVQRVHNDSKISKDFKAYGEQKRGSRHMNTVYCITVNSRCMHHENCEPGEALGATHRQ